jgi:hypothetical protein
MLRFNDIVHVGGSDGVASVAFANPFPHSPDNFCDLHRVRANAQNVECRAVESARL